jgi:hypothetical protein
LHKTDMIIRIVLLHPGSNNKRIVRRPATELPISAYRSEIFQDGANLHPTRRDLGRRACTTNITSGVH